MEGSMQRLGRLAGWKIVLPDSTVLYEGSGPVDGPFGISNSTRYELSGYAAPHLLVTVIARYWGLRHRCHSHWVADSTAAISKVTIITQKGFYPLSSAQ